MGDISLPDVSKLNDLKDDQIEALIEKLAEVQAHAPQIIAALEAQQEARSRGSRSTGSHDRHHRRAGGGRGNNNGTSTNISPARKHRPQEEVLYEEEEEEYEEEEEEEEDDDEDDDEDDEDYDDFDEDAEYPMVGDGYSDELSVVSEMSCPTVVSSMEINEEEYYRDMIVGGMKVNAPKKKDLLSSVGKANARKAPAAIAGVGKKKSAMMNGVAAGAEMGMKKASRPSTRVDKAAASGMTKKKKPKEGSSSSGRTTPTGTKKIKKKTVKKGAISNGGWDAGASSTSFGSKKSRGPQETKSAPVMIDDDGFLVDQSAFETFDSASNPFSSAPSFDTGGNDAGFGDFAGFGATAPTSKKSSKPKKLNVASTGKKKNSSSASAAGNSPKPAKRKGTRRASVGGL